MSDATIARREIAAGGYSRDDGTVDFYQRVCAVTPNGAEILDLGAGRGAQFNASSSYLQFLLRLQGRPQRRVGADVDRAVLENPVLDERVVIDSGKPLPFEDRRFDVVLSDWTVEHIEDPVTFLREVRRVLKPGGWFCARTPNRWSYFAVGARLMSEWAEIALLKRLQPNRRERDVFPKFYRLNTLKDIDRLLANGWMNASYGHNPSPGYAGRSRTLFWLIEGYQKMAPYSLSTVIHIFAERRL